MWVWHGQKADTHFYEADSMRTSKQMGKKEYAKGRAENYV
jgi:hypothetical protein